MTRIAVLSDVHGNLVALEAVLKEIKQGAAGRRRSWRATS